MAQRRPAALRRDRILDAALKLADDAGLGALSMRRLGQALGVEAMSLYNHVANKDAILDGIVARVLTQVALPAAEGDWEEELRRGDLRGRAATRAARPPYADRGRRPHDAAHPPRAAHRCPRRRHRAMTGMDVTTLGGTIRLPNHPVRVLLARRRAVDR